MKKKNHLDNMKIHFYDSHKNPLNGSNKTLAWVRSPKKSKSCQVLSKPLQTNFSADSSPGDPHFQEKWF